MTKESSFSLNAAARFGSLVVIAAFLICASGACNSKLPTADGEQDSQNASENADGENAGAANADSANESAVDPSALARPGKSGGERLVVKIGDADFAFRWAPAGVFDMGSPDDEENRDAVEKAHQVTLTRGFWILETETTQRMWKVVASENPSKWVGDDLPVDTVTAYDCENYCAELTKLAQLPDGVAFDLPTEAQWEYAARAGKSCQDSGATGGQPLEEIAWFGDQNDGGTHPVGTKKSNAWGLYDMLGNLWEWCKDRSGDYQSDENGVALAVVDPTGATVEETPVDIRTDRGGCWDSHDYECRLAYRGYYDGGRKGPYVGFRFVVVPSSSTGL